MPPLRAQPDCRGVVRWLVAALKALSSLHSDPAIKPPVGPRWIHEIKHDGYRLIVCRRAGNVRLLTRSGYDWTERYPLIREALAAPGAARGHEW